MKQKTHHIYRIIAILLFVAIVIPSVVKLAHIFEDHKHEVCINPSDSHFHEVEIDCEFYKFKLNNSFIFIFNDVAIPKIKNNHKNIICDYFFINSYKSFGIVLRGPPSNILYFS